MTERASTAVVGNVLILAPFGRDAQVLADVVHADGGHALVCDTNACFEAAFGETTTAILVTEEGLTQATRTLEICLASQPSWSDIPVIILSGARHRSSTDARWEYFTHFGNVTVLERPLEKRSLQLALRAAQRARGWQYLVRDQLQELERQSNQLERRVVERTHALQAEVEERRRVENALNATRRLEAIGRLTGGVAHDFNNLLQVITGAGALLRRMVKQERVMLGLLDTIDRAGEKASKLTHQLLAFARKQPLNTGSLDLAGLLADMEGLLQQSVRERIEVQLDLQTGLWPVSADPTQLEVALLNLSVNAKDAMPKGGRLRVSARNIQLPDPETPEAEGFSGDFVLITVADTGVGMSMDVAQRAFEPFFTTKPVGGGTGLGLSQVYGFAIQSRGSAWIRSGAAGTEVSLLLPRSKDADPPPAASGKSEPQSVGKDLHGVRVLLVEDDSEVGRITTQLLLQTGCIVARANNADEALALELSGIELIVSDVAMPGSMDGIGLAEKLSKRPGAPPILLVTGYAMAPERIEGLNVRVLSKPYTMEKLQSTMHAILSAARRSS